MLESDSFGVVPVVVDAQDVPLAIAGVYVLHHVVDAAGCGCAFDVKVFKVKGQRLVSKLGGGGLEASLWRCSRRLHSLKGEAGCKERVNRRLRAHNRACSPKEAS